MKIKDILTLLKRPGCQSVTIPLNALLPLIKYANKERFTEGLDIDVITKPGKCIIKVNKNKPSRHL